VRQDLTPKYTSRSRDMMLATLATAYATSLSVVQRHW
jgi:hypothetical protein